MAKTNWNPWIGPLGAGEALDRLLEQFTVLGETAHDAPLPDSPDPSGRRGERQALWQPAADVFETAQAVVIEVEVPGVALEDMALEAHGRALAIFGQRRSRTGQGTYHAMERPHGPFGKRFVLPSGLDTTRASASLRDGVLTITVPKGSSGDRRIRVDETDDESNGRDGA